MKNISHKPKRPMASWYGCSDRFKPKQLHPQCTAHWHQLPSLIWWILINSFLKGEKSKIPLSPALKPFITQVSYSPPGFLSFPFSLFIYFFFFFSLKVSEFMPEKLIFLWEQLASIILSLECQFYLKKKKKYNTRFEEMLKKFGQSSNQSRMTGNIKHQPSDLGEHL